MSARMTTFTFDQTPEHAEAFIRRGRDEVMQAARQLPGSRGFLWLVDRDAGRGLTLTLWATQEAEQASAQAANHLRVGTSQRTGVTLAGAGRYEVAVVNLEPSLAEPG